LKRFWRGEAEKRRSDGEADIFVWKQGPPRVSSVR